MRQQPCSTGGPSRLLATLGLKEQAVRNVMMSKDIGEQGRGFEPGCCLAETRGIVLSRGIVLQGRCCWDSDLPVTAEWPLIAVAPLPSPARTPAVPRAFSCDYSLVAELLKSWGPAFKQHTSLSLDGRKHLYYFVGRMIVLQPDRFHTFVANDPDHPLLPPGPGMYYIAEPGDMLVPKPRGVEGSVGESVGAGSVGPGGGGVEHGQGGSLELLPVSDADVSGGRAPQPTAATSTPSSLPASAPAASKNGASGGGGSGLASAPAPPQTKLVVRRPKVPLSARAALMELMDCPHPLETLADPGAYLDTGSISRYHNPDNYTLVSDWQMVCG